tara:strand:- start:73 stop:204 length:132 start_codon:yes stop_codon:yes gene_type:complete
MKYKKIVIFVGTSEISQELLKLYLKEYLKDFHFRNLFSIIEKI